MKASKIKYTGNGYIPCHGYLYPKSQCVLTLSLELFPVRHCPENKISIMVQVFCCKAFMLCFCYHHDISVSIGIITINYKTIKYSVDLIFKHEDLFSGSYGAIELYI